MNQLTLFDYAGLDTETRIVVQQRTQEIRGLMRRAAQDIVDIGHKLIEVKARLGHGQFEQSLTTEFEWTDQTARRFIHVAQQFGQKQQIVGFAPSALYLLAAPSTPETARQEALDRAADGETITHAAAREIVTFHRQDAPPPPVFAWEPTPTPPVPSLSPLLDTAPRPAYTPYIPPIPYQSPPSVTLPPPTVVVDPPRANHQLINTSTNNEWYTPAPYIEAVHALLGEIDLDPASNDLANAVVRATRYYTAEQDGMNQPWSGRIFLNPPYGIEDGESNQARWSRRLVADYQIGRVAEAVLLVNAVPGNAWFAPLWDFPICFVSRRIRFYNADTPAGQPTHSNVFVYMGPQVAQFVTLFTAFGTVAGRLIAEDGHVAIGFPHPI